jgi:uncharacterized protein YkwD
MSRQAEVQPSSLARFEPLEPRWLLAAAYPTAYDQYMLELINRGRANPAAEAARYGIDLNEGLAAGTLTGSAKQPLAFNPYLVDAAQKHSTWMYQTQQFSHTGANNSTPGDRMAAAGYSFVAPWTWAENIAIVGMSSTVQAAVESQYENLFVDSLQAGRGHRINYMNGTLREIGVGTVRGNWSGVDSLMTTQDFAAAGASYFLTGVAYDDSAVTQNSFYTPGEGLGSVTIRAVRTSDNATYTTTTWASGGYTLALPTGIYNVTASGGSLSSPMLAQNVTVSGQNVKVDFDGSQAAQWTQVGAFSGLSSMILDAEVDPANASHILLGTASGIYQTTDAGAHWTLVQAGVARQVAFNLQNSHVAYAAGDGGVYKSTDGGGTWTLHNTGMDAGDRTIGSLAIAAGNPDILFAGTYASGGVYRSIDAGLTWSYLLDAGGVLSTTDAVFVKDLSASPDGQTVFGVFSVYYSENAGDLLKSTNGGATWAQSVTPLDGVINGMAMDPTGSQTLYIGGNSHIYRSTDGGGTWTEADTGLPTSTLVPDIVVDRANPARVYTAVGNTVYASADWGNHWLAQSEPVTALASDVISTLAIDPSNPVIYASVLRDTDPYTGGAEEGLYRGSRADTTAPQFSITYGNGATAILDGQATVIDLGTFAMGATATGLTFTLRNTGTSTLLVTSLLPTYAHVTATQPTTNTLLPGQAATFTLTLKTDTVGTFTQAISITSNDVAHSPFDFNVTGTVALPDLVGVFGAGAFATTVVPGDTLRVPLVLTNQDHADAVGTIYVALYASTDPGFGTQTALGAPVRVSLSLAALASRAYTLSVVVPTDLPAGDYYVRAVIDSTNVIAESDETNNTVTSAGTQAVAWRFGTFDGRRNASLTLKDFLGSPVVFALSGGGYGEITGNDATGFTLEFTGTNGKSAVKVTPAKGHAATLNGVVVHGSLGSFAASAVNLDGDFTAAGTLTKLTLNDATDAQITLNSPVASAIAAALTFNRVTDTAVISNLPIKSITANEWLNTDATAETIAAPSLGTLTINKKAASAALPGGTSGNFQADLWLTGPAAGNTLGTVTLGGNLTDSHWDVTGRAGNVTVKGLVNGWDWGADGGSLVTTGAGVLKLGAVIAADLLAGGPISSVTAVAWLAGSLQATRIPTIKITGGNLGADVTLTDGTLVGATPVVKTLTVAGWLDGASIFSAGPLGTITVGGIRSSTIYAGIDGGVTGLPGAGDFNLFTNAKGAAVSGIAGFTLKGIVGQAFLFIDSNVAAWTMGKVTIAAVQTDNSALSGDDFGVAGHAIATYKRDALSWSKVATATPPQDFQHDGNFFVRLY